MFAVSQLWTTQERGCALELVRIVPSTVNLPTFSRKRLRSINRYREIQIGVIGSQEKGLQLSTHQGDL